MVPVTVRCDNPDLNVRLYPEQVEVSFWLPTKDYANVKAGQFQVSVTIDEQSTSPELKVNIDQFPSFAQIRSVTPTHVKYVVIK